MKRSPMPPRKAPMRNTKPMARKRAKRPSKPKQRDGFPDEVKAQARRRAGHRCEIGGPDCSGRIEEFHHRQLRSQGGKHTIENCLAVCSADHRRIHENPAKSYLLGWLVKSYMDPAQVRFVRADVGGR